MAATGGAPAGAAVAAAKTAAAAAGTAVRQLMGGGSTKRRMDRLFFAHAVVAGLAGAMAFVFPHLFEWFMIHHGEAFALRDNTGNDDQKVTHMVTRMYGAIIVAQAWLTWRVRTISDADTRRTLVQANAATFALTTLTLLRAQTTEGGALNGCVGRSGCAIVGVSDDPTPYPTPPLQVELG